MVLFKKMMVTFKSPTRLHLQKTRFDKTMSPSKPNKLPQEQNSYLISFSRYSSGSFKMGHLVFKVKRNPCVYYCSLSLQEEFLPGMY